MIKRKKIAVQQRDSTDCGAACLASILAWYRQYQPVAKIRQKAGTGRHGTTLRGLMEAAEFFGLSAKGVRCEMADLQQIPFPAIAHMILENQLHHYCVLYQISSRSVRLMDPADGRLHKLTLEQFRKRWSGTLLLTMPKADFSTKNRKVGVLRRLAFLLRPHRSTILQTLLGAAMYTLLGLATAIYVQLIIDHVLADGNRKLLNLLGVSMVVLLLLRVFIGSVKKLFILKTGQLIDARLILGYFRHLLHLPLSFFDRMQTGEILSRINDAVKIRVFINDAALQIAVNLFILLFSFLLMSTYYWKLGLVLFIMIPGYISIYLVTNFLNRRSHRAVMERTAELESELVESIQSIAAIKLFGLEERAGVKTDSRFVHLLQAIHRSGLNSIFSFGSTTFLSGSFIILLFWIGSLMVMDGLLTPGELLSFYTVIGYFTGSVDELVHTNRTIQDALIAGDRLFELLDLDQEKRDQPIVLTREMVGDIRFENIDFSYGSIPILKNLSITLPRGKVTAIVGESGSGKTTLLNILLKLYPVRNGSVRIGDIDLDDIETASLRSLTSCVPQQLRLLSGTVIDNIAVGEPAPDMEHLFNICRELDLLPFIHQLPNGFETSLGENAVNLSGGQKQKIALARALYRNPEILLLDEATASLDTASEKPVQDVIRRLRNENRTVLLITHRMNSVLAADQICVMKDGSVVETGNHHALIHEKGIYYKLCAEQFPLSNGFKKLE